MDKKAFAKKQKAKKFPRAKGAPKAPKPAMATRMGRLRSSEDPC